MTPSDVFTFLPDAARRARTVLRHGQVRPETVQAIQVAVFARGWVDANVEANGTRDRLHCGCMCEWVYGTRRKEVGGEKRENAVKTTRYML